MLLGDVWGDVWVCFILRKPRKGRGCGFKPQYYLGMLFLTSGILRILKPCKGWDCMCSGGKTESQKM